MTAAAPQSLDLGAHVDAIEHLLGALDQALVSQDAGQVESCSQALHAALAQAVAAFRQASREGREPLSPELRHKLLLAQARVMGQQATVRRAAASIERTLGVLLPQEAQATYSALAPRAAAVANAYR